MDDFEVELRADSLRKCKKEVCIMRTVTKSMKNILDKYKNDHLQLMLDSRTMVQRYLDALTMNRDSYVNSYRNLMASMAAIVENMSQYNLNFKNIQTDHEEELKEKLAEITRVKFELEKYRADSVERLMQKNIEIDKLKSENGVLKSQKKRSTDDSSEYEKAKYKKRNEELEESLKRKNARLDEVEIDLKRKNAEFDNLARENSRLLSSSSSQKSSSTTSKNDPKGSVGDLRRLTEENGLLKEKIAELESNMDYFEKETLEKQIEVSNMEYQKIQIDEQLNEAKEQLKRALERAEKAETALNNKSK